MSKLCVVVAALAGATGCVADDLGLSQLEQHASRRPGDCEVYGCGQNSPEVEGKLFWELNERGEFNNEHIRIEKFELKVAGVWKQFRPDVVNGELRANHLSTNAPAYFGTSLAGAKFTLYDKAEGLRYYLTVSKVGETQMWTTLGKSTWDYELVYTSDKTPERQYLCSAAGTANAGTMNPFRAVLFDDDRISPEKLVVGTEVPNWFTIGCAGSALAKLHLSAHTKAGSAQFGVTTSTSERTAYLKMLTADYCGNGNAWTFAHMPLHYRTANRLVSTVKAGEKIEAMWTKDGASCLNLPRIDANPTPESLALFGDSILDELTDSSAPWGCAVPPPCSQTTYDPSVGFSGDVISTVY